jgi:hypothetical protein
MVPRSKKTNKLSFIPDRPKFTPRALLGHPSGFREYPTRESIFGYLSHFYREAIETLNQHPVPPVKGRCAVTDIYSFEHLIEQDFGVTMLDRFLWGVEDDFGVYIDRLINAECTKEAQIQLSAIEALLSVWRVGLMLSPNAPTPKVGVSLEAAILETMTLVFAAVRIDFKGEYEQKILNEIADRRGSKGPRPGRSDTDFHREVKTAIDELTKIGTKANTKAVWGYLREQRAGKGVIKSVDQYSAKKECLLTYREKSGSTKPLKFKNFGQVLSRLKNKSKVV